MVRDNPRVSQNCLKKKLDNILERAFEKKYSKSQKNLGQKDIDQFYENRKIKRNEFFEEERIQEFSLGFEGL